jgi:glycosyltransferase involved in cell wall biosynthesis
MSAADREGSPRGRRIAVVTTSYPSAPGDPSGHFVCAEVEALRAAGHDVRVIAPRPAGCEPADSAHVHWVDAGVAFGFPGALARFRAAPLHASFGAFRFVRSARDALTRFAPETVIAHFLVPSAWPIATRAGAPRLEVVAHGSDVRLVARLPRVLRARIARRLAQAEVRCVSEQLRSELLRALGPNLSRRIRVEPSPLALPIRPDRASARASLGVAVDQTLALVVARLVPGKRVAAALRAARSIPGALSVVVGEGPERRRLEHLFPEARFTGQLPRAQTLTWIAASDVLISASRDEGAPTVVREARALGTAVLAVASGDLEAWARDDPGLWVVKGAAEPAGARRCGA